jgi:ATP-binding cassette, subfamily C, bacterial CydC
VRAHRAPANLRRLLGFIRPFTGRVSLSLLLGAGTVLSSVGLLATASYLISEAALGTALVLLTVPIYLVRFFGVSRAACRYAERLFSHDATFRLLANLRVYFYTRLEPLAPAQLTHRRSGDLLSRITKDIDELQDIYLRGLAPVAVAFLVMLVAGAFFYVFDPILAVVAVALLAASGAGIPVFVGLLSRGLARREITVRSEMNAQLVDGIQGLQDLLAFGREKDHAASVEILGRKLGAIQRRKARISALQNSLGDLAAGLAALALFFLAAPLVASGEIRGVYLAALVLVALGAFEALGPLGGAFKATGRSLAAAGRLFEITDAEPEVEDPETPLPCPVTPSIKFRDVGFRYSEDEPLALDGVNLRVESGSRVAVVGPSGSGKSTLAHLLLRFQDPQKGEVRVGGEDVRRYAGRDLRGFVGLVAQETYVFNESLRENLLLPHPGATEKEIERAVEAAGLSEVVERLPDGLDTRVGEQGLKLSGGERQRLAVARVLLEDPKILVLDEASANLDAATEGALRESVGELSGDRTIVHITHRLVGMEEMGEVFVMDRGRIVERGTHEKLARSGGLYARMLRIQSDLLTEA